jgi:sec-independent protein translocase protein TatA
MPSVGPWEVFIVLIIALLVFGPKKLPEMGRSMGKGIREFKSSINGDDRDDDDVPVRRAQELPPAAPPAPAERVTTPSGSTSTPR